MRSIRVKSRDSESFSSAIGEYSVKFDKEEEGLGFKKGLGFH